MFPRSRLNEAGANVVIVFVDSVKRQIGMYLNGFTPFISAEGIGPDPFPVPTVDNLPVFGGGGATATDGGKVRQAGGVVCATALQQSAFGRAQIRALLRGAGETYGIALAA